MSKSTEIPDSHLRWMISKRYELKLYCVRRSQWRKKAGLEWVKEKMGTADQFIATWNYLNSAVKNILNGRIQ